MPRPRRLKSVSKILDQISNIRFTDVKQWCLRRLPVLSWAPRYSLQENLLLDTVSGFMLTVQQVAQGKSLYNMIFLESTSSFMEYMVKQFCIYLFCLAFAVMSSVHPVFGLYSSLFPPIIYAVFGMSHHVSTGTFAITSLISAGAVERLVSSNNANVTNGSHGVLGLSDFEMQRIGVAAAVTLLGGIVQISMFLLCLGGATFLFSEPVVSSMTTGAATHVVTSQIKYFLGMKVPYISGPLGMFHIYHYILVNIRSAQVETFLISVFAITILIVVKECNEHFRSKIRIVIPIDLLLIIATSLACYFADMENIYGIDVVGPIPKGIPYPQVPPMNIIMDVAVEAFSFALVGYTVSIYLAYNSAKKFKYHINENQELLAHGLSNVIPSFLFCIPNAAAPARTFLLYNNGSKTQVACLISCLMVLLVIYFISPFLYWLPMCVLASVIVVALKGMLIQFRDLKKYWNVDKHDWVIWVCTYLVTICFAANIGLLFGVVFSMALGLFRLTRARTLNVIQVDEDIKDMPSPSCVPDPSFVYLRDQQPWHSRSFGTTFPMRLSQPNEWLSIMGDVVPKHLESQGCRPLVYLFQDAQNRVKCVSVGIPVFFLNAKKFLEEFKKTNSKLYARSSLLKHKSNPLLSPVTNGACNDSSSDKSSTLIIDCSGITFFDYTGAATLAQICLELPNQGTDVLLAGCDVKALQYRGFGIEHQLFFDSVKCAFTSLQSKQSCATNVEALDSSDL